jgi:hypothetical protein
MIDLLPNLDRHINFLLNRHNGADLIRRIVIPHLGFLERLIKHHHLDKYRKKHNALSYFYALALSPIFNQNSSRTLSGNIENHPMLTNVCGFNTIPHHGSFSEHYPKFKEPFLTAVVDELVELLRKHGAIKKNDTAIYDVTYVICNTDLSEWGWCGSTHGTEFGIRVHLAYGMNSDIPLKVIVTEGNVHETMKFDDLRRRAKELGFKRNAKDRGYTDYSKDKEITLRGDFYVTTMKSNCDYVVLRSKLVEHEHAISDKIIWINSMEMAVRAIEAKKSRGCGTYYILTNDIFAKLDDIFKENKGRWNIEDHNNVLKHVLNMNTIKSKSVDGVVASIYFSIIAFLVLKLFALLTNIKDADVRSIVKYIRYPLDEIKRAAMNIRMMFLKANEMLLSAPKGTQINTPITECL